MWAKAFTTIGVWAAWASIPIFAMKTYSHEPGVMIGVVIYSIITGFCVAMLSADMWGAKTPFGEGR